MAELLTSKTLFPGNDHILLPNRLTRDLRKWRKGCKNCVEREVKRRESVDKPLGLLFLPLVL